MNFFSNLLGSIGSGISNAYNYVSGGITNAVQGINNLLGTSGTGTNIFNSANAASYNYSPEKYAASVTNAGLDPNKTVNFTSTGQSYQQNPTTGANNYGTQPVFPTYMNSLAANAPRPLITGPTGSTISAAQPQQGANYTSFSNPSNSNVGNPYFDASGNYVVPKVAFSGSSGSSSNTGYSFAPALTPTNGSSGLSGGSAYTGTLGATGLGTSSPLTGTTQTEEDKAKQKKIQDLFNFGGQSNSSPVPGITPTTGGATTPAFGPGVLSPYVQQPNITPTQTPSPLQAPTVNNNVNVTDLTQPTNAALNTSHAVAVDDTASTNQAINQNFTTAKQKLDAQYPTAPNLTTDTREQLQAINSSPDPYGVRAALDAYKAQSTNLSTLEASRIDVLKSISALDQAYNPIIQDIKSNPDLPKGLAARRLTDLNTKQKDVLLGFTNQLNLLNTSIEDENTAVNRAFNLVQFSQSAQEKATDNSRQLLNTMVTTGAIGGMSDTELSQLAQASGVPLDGLTKARSVANNPAKNVQVETDDSGNVRGIDQLTGKVLWSLNGAGKSNATANSAANVPGYSQSLVTQLLNRNSGVTFASLPASDKNIALKAFQDQGLTIPRPLTQQEKNAADQATGGLTAIEGIRNMFQNGGLPLTADSIAPASGLVSSAMNYFNPNLSQYRTYANEAADIVTRIRTGAALNNQEIAFYQSKLPKLGDNDATINNKLDQLTGFYLGMSGLPVTVTNPTTKESYTATDLYDPQQRLGLRRAIDSGYSISY